MIKQAILGGHNVNFFVGTLIGSLTYFIENIYNILGISPSELFVYSLKAFISAVVITFCKIGGDIIKEKFIKPKEKEDGDDA